MALPERTPFPRIVHDPRIHGGEPTVRGTRVPVRAIVVTWRAEPNVRTLLEAYPRLSERDLQEALAYYDAHGDEMDERFRAQFAEA
jgi:uncharacterized protein (DUF433 family)